MDSMTSGGRPQADRTSADRPNVDGAGSAADVSDAIRRLSRASVLVIGDAMLDRYIYGHVQRISPEAPIPILSVEREVALPGGAGNVVRNLTALGAAVAFVSVVGDDQPGSDLTGLIGGQPGVEPWLLIQGGRVTTRKTRFVAHGQQLLRTDREVVTPVQPKLVERMLRIAGDAMAATTVTVLSDYAKGVLAGDVPQQLIALARQIGRRVIVEPRGTDYARYAGADIVIPSARDLTAVTGLGTETEEEVAAAGTQLCAQFSFGAALVLRGEAGMTLIENGTVLHLRPRLAEMFDMSGVGDAVLATLSAAIAAGSTLPLAAALANLAAGVVSAKVGNGVARDTDLLAALAE